MSASYEDIQIMKLHLANMINYTYISRHKKDAPYYGVRLHGSLTHKMKVAVKKEIEDIKKWLSLNDEDEIKKLTMDHLESDLRLLLVRNFIDGINTIHIKL